MIRSKILANYYLFYLLGVKLSAVSNCPPPLVGVKLSYFAWWCQIVLGVKLSFLPSWCQIVLLAIMVSNCPKCQMVLGVKLSAVSNGPRILNIKSQLILFLSIKGLGGRLARKEWVCQKFRRLASNPIHGSHQGSYFFNLRFKNRSFVVGAET